MYENNYLLMNNGVMYVWLMIEMTELPAGQVSMFWSISVRYKQLRFTKKEFSLLFNKNFAFNIKKQIMLTVIKSYSK